MRARVVAQVSSSLLVTTLVSACVLLGLQRHHSILSAQPARVLNVVYAKQASF